MKFKDLLDVLEPGIRLLIVTVNHEYDYDRDDTTFEGWGNSIFLPELDMMFSGKGEEILKKLYGNRRVFRFDPEEPEVYLIAKDEESLITKWAHLN